MQDDNKPKLTLVKGEKQDSDKLTSKQETFAQGLAEGLTASEAYRRAYSADGMKPATVHVEACKQAQHPKVARRVDEILAEKRERNSMGALKREERVWRGVWRLAESENIPPAVQQSALALAAKMAGMLTDKVEIEQKGSDSKSIEAEIRERLQKLAG
jgi:phage terminase small subunit